MVHGCGIEPREILASQGKPLILMQTLTSEAVLDPEFGSWENRCKQVYGVAALAIFCLHVE